MGTGSPSRCLVVVPVNGETKRDRRTNREEKHHIEKGERNSQLERDARNREQRESESEKKRGGESEKETTMDAGLTEAGLSDANSRTHVRV